MARRRFSALQWLLSLLSYFERTFPLAELPIERRVLRDQVKAYLTDAILSGFYKPGERLVETRIAQRLGVSQAPVREAIRELELMGFLKSEPFRGASVRQRSRLTVLSRCPFDAPPVAAAFLRKVLRSMAFLLEKFVFASDRPFTALCFPGRPAPER